MRTIDLARDVPELEDYITDVSLACNEVLDDGGDVFIEGSQGFALSLYYGSYPFVTSKDTTASTFAADVGVGPTKLMKSLMYLNLTFPVLVKVLSQQK